MTLPSPPAPPEPSPLLGLRRFRATTAREALARVRAELGDDAVVLHTRRSDEGVEVLAMVGDDVDRLRAFDRAGDAPGGGTSAAEPLAEARPPSSAEVRHDVDLLSMTTLSFQDYVRERMLKRRREAMDKRRAPPSIPSAAPAPAVRDVSPASDSPTVPPSLARVEPPLVATVASPALPEAAAPARDPAARDDTGPALARLEAQVQSLRALFDERLRGLAMAGQLHADPRRAVLTHRFVDAGFPAAVVRELVVDPPTVGDVGELLRWAELRLSNELLTDVHQDRLEARGGVMALVGAAGSGKSTAIAKIASQACAFHGSTGVGLIALDPFQCGSYDALRTHGRLLGIPVHTAHDDRSLDDLLALLAARAVILVDTPGLAPRDPRTRELIALLSRSRLRRVMVIDAGAQGESIDDAIAAIGTLGHGEAILTKLDQAVKLAPALGVVIRHRLRLVGVGNGQSLRDHWHRADARTLIERALGALSPPAWRLEASEARSLMAACGEPGFSPASADAPVDAPR